MKHADETTWSCDGRHGCAWGFFTALVSPCRLRGTRGASVAAEVFGDGPHVGVLGVDRYAAYGGTWKGAIQHCLEHYKRNVGDLLEAEPENAEYKKCIPGFLDLLREAMTLRRRFRGEEYGEESRRVRFAIACGDLPSERFAFCGAFPPPVSLRSARSRPARSSRNLLSLLRRRCCIRQRGRAA